MLAVTLVVSVLCGLVFGLVPALHMAPRRERERSRSPGGGRSGSASASRSASAKGTLAVAEMALSVVLLTGAGLLLRSFMLLSAVDPGFVAGERLAFSVSLPDARYETPEKSAAFIAELLSRLRALPGVRDAGAVSGLPLTGYSYSISAHDLDGRVHCRIGPAFHGDPDRVARLLPDDGHPREARARSRTPTGMGRRPWS